MTRRPEHGRYERDEDDVERYYAGDTSRDFDDALPASAVLGVLAYYALLALLGGAVIAGAVWLAYQLIGWFL